MESIAENKYEADAPVLDKVKKLLKYINDNHPLCYEYLNAPFGNPKVYNLTNAEKEMFIENLAATNASSDNECVVCALRETANGFSDKRKLKLKHPEYRNQQVGRVSSKERIIREVEDVVEYPYRSQIAVAFEEALKETTITDQKNFFEDEFKSLDFLLCPSDYLMWAFFDTEDEPLYNFTGDDSELLRRLGLEQDGEMVLWYHQVPDGARPRYPTVLNSDLNPQWRAGGRTFPIGNKEGDYDGAFYELVHEPITAASLTGLIRDMNF